MSKLSRKSGLRDTSTASPLAALIGRRKITKTDVASLRASEIGLGLRSRTEAEMMFAIERSSAEKCRGWSEFMVEVLTDFVVWDQRPSGTLTEETALWLSDQVGEVPTPASLALLVAILDEAETIPPWLTSAVRLRASKLFGNEAGNGLQHAA